MHGYHWTVFDLGGLGFGRSFPVTDEVFQSTGCYQTNFQKWPSRAMHKPQVIGEFVNSATDLVVYLDADTLVRQNIDEIVGDYDIGVTVRRPREQKRLGKVNAGVVFFRPTSRAKIFIERWKRETQTLGNDQEALNALLAEPDCTVAEFPTEIYNWYYFPQSPPKQAKIIHYRASSYTAPLEGIAPPP